MPGNQNTFLNYTEDAMKAAVEDVRQHKISIRAAAKKFAVPRTTLKYKLEGKSPMDRKMEISKWDDSATLVCLLSKPELNNDKN